MLTQYPLNSDQRLLLDLVKDNLKAQNAYTDTLLIKLPGQIDIQRLTQALEKIASRHEILRTHFYNTDHHVVLNSRDINLKVTSLNNLPLSQKITSFQMWLKELANYPFKLIKEPLYDFCYCQWSHQTSILAITAINFVTDGISMNILSRELAMFYHDSNKELPTPMQHQQFIQANTALITKHPEHFKYWETILLQQPLSRINLLTTKIRPDCMSFKGTHLQFDIDTSLILLLRTFSQKNQLTLFMTLLAGFCLMLHQLTRQNDFIIGIPFANRPSKESQNCIGFCISILPIRSTLKPNFNLIAYLQSIRDAVLNLFEHAYVDINQILEKSNIELTHARPFYYDVLFNLEQPHPEIEFGGDTALVTGLNSPYSELKLDDPSEEVHVQLSTGHAQFDLTANIIEQKDKFSAAFEFNTDIFSDNDMYKIKESYLSILNDLISDNFRSLY